MERMEIHVAGMTCDGCVKSIQNALTRREGVLSAAADLDSATVTVEFDARIIQKDGLEQAISEAGFDVTP